MTTVSLHVDAGQRIPLRISEGGADFNVSIGGAVYGTTLPEYTGDYEAIPSWEQQVFPTAGRTMRNDFEVEGILKLEVDNEAGGLTLTI